MSGNHFLTIGHRGARGLYPENTISSFFEAVRLGVNSLEMDVVVSKDKKVVVSHEPWMNKAFCSTPDGLPVQPHTRRKFNFYKMSYEEIRQFDCGKRGNPQFPHQKAVPEYKPLLSEVIEKVNALVQRNSGPYPGFLIEIKSEPEEDNFFNPEPAEFVKLVYDVIKKEQVSHQVCIQSFDTRILNEMHDLDPTINMALLVENWESLEYNLELLNFLPVTYSPEYSLVEPTLVSEVHAMNMRLIPWTVNEVDDMRRLLEMGVDGIITDYPDRTLELRKNSMDQ